MSPNMTKVSELIKYWIEIANHDYQTALSLFKSKRYSDCLFYGHIVLEKTLKAHVVNETNQQAPFSHDLLVLYKILKRLKLSKEEIDLLNDVNHFNIRARYPDVKLRFYKQCTPQYTRQYFYKIEMLYKKLCQLMKQRK